MKPTLAEALKLAREKQIDTARLEYALENRVLGRIRDRQAQEEADPMAMIGWLGLRMAGLAGLIAMCIFADYQLQAQDLAETSFRILTGDSSSWLF